MRINLVVFGKKLQTLFTRFSHIQRKAFSWFFVQCIYVIGLGLTSIIGRVLGNRFIDLHPSKTTWKRHANEMDARKMF